MQRSCLPLVGGTTVQAESGRERDGVPTFRFEALNGRYQGRTNIPRSDRRLDTQPLARAQFLRFFDSLRERPWARLYSLSLEPPLENRRANLLIPYG